MSDDTSEPDLQRIVEEMVPDPGPSVGTPVRVFMVVEVIPRFAVRRQFRGPTALGDAQSYQRRYGGLIMEALEWSYERT